MNLKQELQADMATAMRSGDVIRRDTLRMLIAAIKQEEVDSRVDLDGEGFEKVLAKQAKQRRESIIDAEKAKRSDLMAQEQAELDIIESYLPQQMTEKEVRAAALDVIAETGASGLQDMGLVMQQLMPALKGQADGRLVSQIVRELLQD